jgi:hypothetical protein
LGQLENHNALFEIWWWMVEKSLKKIIGRKTFFGVVQFKNPQALFWIWW